LFLSDERAPEDFAVAAAAAAISGFFFGPEGLAGLGSWFPTCRYRPIRTWAGAPVLLGSTWLSVLGSMLHPSPDSGPCKADQPMMIARSIQVAIPAGLSFSPVTPPSCRRESDLFTHIDRASDHLTAIDAIDSDPAHPCPK